jgi:hypothetical protein
MDEKVNQTREKKDEHCFEWLGGRYAQNQAQNLFVNGFYQGAPGIVFSLVQKLRRVYSK